MNLRGLFMEVGVGSLWKGFKSMEEKQFPPLRG